MSFLNSAVWQRRIAIGLIALLHLISLVLVETIGCSRYRKVSNPKRPKNITPNRTMSFSLVGME